MEQIKLDNSPKQKGWYLGLKQNDDPVVFFVMEPKDSQYIIRIPWDFSLNPNFGHVFDPKTWIVTEIDKATKKIADWPPLKQVLRLQDCISGNIDVEMAYRKSLIGSNIKLNDKTYKISNTYHHIHSWTIYNIENVENHESRQIQLTGYNDWSFGGIDKIDVEILSDI